MVWTDDTFRLTCERSGTEHEISVSTPFRYERMSDATLIVCLDGAWTAGAVRDATRIMSMNGDAPEAIVAGVSFTDDSMGGYLRSRARWYTPTPWVPPEETGVRGVDADECGQALTFLGFVRDQLLPQLDDRYRIGERWLMGHSFSALCGLRVLFTAPSLFDRYLLASPSIWWDDRSILDVEDAYAADHDDLAVTVFVSAGGLEDDEFGGEYGMQRNVEHLVTRLRDRAYPGLSLSHAVLPAENHSSTIGAAISRGLRALSAS